MLHIKFGFGWQSGFREEDLWNCGRTPDHGHPISSPCEPNGSGVLGSGELKIHSFHFFPCKSLCFQNWHCRKIGQGHPRVIILSNYDGLKSPMLHIKFRGNRPTGSGEEDFLRVFTIYGRGGHLGHVTWISRSNLKWDYPRRLHIKFQLDRPSGFREEDLWNCGRRTDGRRIMAIL